MGGPGRGNHPWRRLAAAAAASAGIASASLGVAWAQTVTPVQTQHAELRLLPASQGLDANGEAVVGLEFTLDPGWHIYWRSPGDAGLPPEVSWGDSANLAASALAWPRPSRYELLGIQTIAYSYHVIFPVTLRASDPHVPLTAVADVNFLICSEICIPDRATVSLTLPAGGGGATEFAHDIGRYQAQVPVAPELAGIQVSDISIAGEGQAGTVSLTVESTAPLSGTVDLLLEAGTAFVFGKPEILVAADRLSATMAAPVEAWGAEAAALADETLTLTVLAGERAMEQSLVPAAFNPATLPGSSGPPAASGPAPVAAGALVGLIAIAVLGGLILNLMPCVLPVLSLKVLSVVSHGGGNRRDVRRSFLASAAGILSSFLVLALAAIALREAGVAVGWGMQFQQPVFLAAMLLIVSLFAFSLFGLFHIRLPGAVAEVAAGAGGPGPSKSLGSHFLTGAFATLLATPCTAPFVGTALGFALSRGSMEILAIFLAMGIGLALPYLAIALFPAVATRLPRPGRWMLWLTRIMGLALVATAVWLVTVLASQIGWDAAVGVAALVALIGAVFLVRRLLPEARIARHAGYAAGLLAVAAVAAVVVAPQISTAGRVSDDGIAWAPFDPAAIPGLVAGGRTVFVDVTADWCLTCIYNKTAVLEQGAVRAMLEDGDAVVAMLADWTNPDPAIADYLASFGRYGIPFNAVYGPEIPQGIALPELLTQSSVLDAIAAASGEDSGALASR
ncbi:MAG: protein-disulfide reductase DsbD family protein [Alphaproteobacteria bacterium]